MLTCSTQRFFSQSPASDASFLSGPAPSTLIDSSQPFRPLIAQQFEDNLFNNAQGTFDNFVESGQVWALLIGLAVGYMIRSLTAF